MIVIEEFVDEFEFRARFHELLWVWINDAIVVFVVIE